MRENLAVTLSAGFLGGEASSVVPILVGIRYYIADPGAEDFVRLFLSTSVGSFLGFEASNTMLRQEARSESTFGGKAGVGIDFFVSNYFKLVAIVTYSAMLDFKTPIGARTNYNGSDFFPLASRGLCFLIFLAKFTNASASHHRKEESKQKFFQSGNAFFVVTHVFLVVSVFAKRSAVYLSVAVVFFILVLAVRKKNA